MLTELRLYSKLDDNKKTTIIRVYKHAETFYARTTWINWIDHGIKHINNVLRNLDRLIPEIVIERIGSDESFILLASTILHDIGMIPRGSASISSLKDSNDIHSFLTHYNEIRKNHGNLGAEICRDEFRNIINDHNLLERICDIIKNHHGNFCPNSGFNLGAIHHSSDALLVRLADGLDFGPERAPAWLFDFISPEGDQEKYWKDHLKIHAPIIDNRFFRIRVSGIANDDDFIQGLKDNFHRHQDEQKIFFNRGFRDEDVPCFYIIWDETTKEPRVGEDSIKESRPTIFNKESYLKAGRYLYNMAQYEAAKKAFEDGIGKSIDKCFDFPYRIYLYHYLQTYNKLGEYQQMIDQVKNQDISQLSHNEQADIKIALGIAYLKLRRNEEAASCFNDALAFYRFDEGRNTINIADCLVWKAITTLENCYRSNLERQTIITQMEVNIKTAEKYFNEYKEKNKGKNEVHYKGRFHGLIAFYNILKAENAQSDDEKADLLNEAIENAQKAYGGTNKESRVPFGVMSGKYAEAAVYLTKYNNLKDNKSSNFMLSVDSLTEVLRSYKKIYGNNRIPYTIDKIETMANILLHLKKDDKHELIELCQDLSINLSNLKNKIEIFTPLN